MGLAKIKLNLRAGGNPEAVVINDQDISTSVYSLRLDAEAKGTRVPQLILQTNGEVELEGEGIVHLEPPAADFDPLEVVRSFLESLNAEELEARALSHMEGLADTGTGQAFLEALKELAGGD